MKIESSRASHEAFMKRTPTPISHQTMRERFAGEKNNINLNEMEW